MREVICKECTFIGELKLKTVNECCREIRKTPICTCIDNADINYISGDYVNAFCEDVNRYGECRYFNWIHPEPPDVYNKDSIVFMTFTNYKAGDQIYYTTSTEDPSIETWTLYTGVFEILETTTFRAFVYRPETNEFSDVKIEECKIV